MERKQLIRVLTALVLLQTITLTYFSPGALGVTTTENTIQELRSSIEISPGVTSVQDAINHAASGATLQIAAGTYTEILTIDKPIQIIGMGPTQTHLIINSPHNGYAIRITAEGVILSDLTVTNQGPGLYTTGIKTCADHTTIQNCTVQDTPIGIALWNSTNTISNCEFRGCDDEGIVLLGTATTPCTNNTITGCRFYKNCDGIELQYATYNAITSCTFSQNTHAGIDAIISNNNNNIISQCTFSDNQGFGIYLTESSQNVITQCSFSNDIISFVHASENTLLESQVNHIHLIEDSYLRVEQCKDLNESTIKTQQSSYEIFDNQPEQPFQESSPQRMTRHSVLFTIMSRVKILKSFYEQIHQLRM